MPRGTFDYMAGGADDEVTLRDNVDAWGRHRLRPHVLRDVSRVVTTTTVLGTTVATPVLVAPVSYLRLVHDEGERAMAGGAAAAGTVMTLSTRSSCPIEDVAVAGAGGAQWFQVYVLRDRGWTGELVDRAVAAGFRALVLTVDTPVLGYRRRDVLNAFELPEGITMANVASRVSPEVAEAEGLLAAYQAPDLVPADLAWLAERSGLPVVAKGVLTPEAARECVAAGAAAVVVSNHGGRQLDGAVATADALAAVADAVRDAVEVYVDGGVRRGTDVLKALALGARAVMVGRPVVWGLATSGAEGVRDVLGHLTFELGAAMALAGVREPGEVDRGMVDLRPPAQ